MPTQCPWPRELAGVLPGCRPTVEAVGPFAATAGQESLVSIESILSHGLWGDGWDQAMMLWGCIGVSPLLFSSEAAG